MTVDERPNPRHAKAAQALASLEKGHSNQVVLSSLRFIKNGIIGNPTKKRFYLRHGIATRLVECLTEFKSDAVLMGEIAPIVGSLAQLEVATLVEAGVMIPLFGALSCTDSRVVEASARALRQIVQHPLSLVQSDITQHHIYHLVALSRPPAQSSSPASIHISEIAVSILARLAEKQRERQSLSDSGCISILIEWLSDDWVNVPRVQEAALDALASMCKSSGDIASTVAACNGTFGPPADLTLLVQSGKNVVASLFKMLQDRRASMRLGASSCLANLFVNSALPAEFEALVPQQLLPAIIRLFDDCTTISSQLGINITSIQERAIYLFSVLIENNTNLQSNALEGDAITKLSRVLIGLEPKEGVDAIIPTEVSCNPDKLRESVLLAVASVSSQTEECRRQVIDLKLLPSILSGLENPLEAIRIAACRCTRSLSRSVKNLRTSLVDAGIAQPLFNLLFDPSIQVQIIASATLCNVVLDFSPMKRIVIERGGVQQLVKLIRSEHAELRLNAAWALKNMLFQADLDMKKGVMSHLGWPTLTLILNDREAEIQTQALNLFRNLACAKTQDIDFVFDGFGAASILDLIEDKLSNLANPIPVLVHTIYIIVNIAIGSLTHKAAIMSRTSILHSIINFMRHPSDQVRIGAIWSIINLTWPEDQRAIERVQAFKELGAEAALQGCLANDPNLDVRDRARTALNNLGSFSEAMTVDEDLLS
ncbi:hypothetical protein HDU91_005336 [Kappamyces sp. JEL0680]|nr:hypothetical protein HDU91_005336 [Kappamyces sp. JEL0680]